MDFQNPEKPQGHALSEVWVNMPDFFDPRPAELSAPSVEKLFGDFFSMGEYYYYVLEVATGKLSSIHPSILPMHGLSNYPTHLAEIIELVHPEDLPFVIAAEKMCYDKISAIGREHVMSLKSSYCFRMKTAPGNYELFHHQAIHTASSPEGKILQAVNIHTNIHHITTHNKYVATVAGFGERSDFCQMKFQHERVLPIERCLTKREIELIHLLAKGHSTQEIASALNISRFTVDTHRKNILSKAGCKNATELIKRAFEEGLI